MKMLIVFEFLIIVFIGDGFCLDMKGWEGYGGFFGLFWYGILGGVFLGEV